ncbi:bifunctional nuclease family protein [Kamptonema cortianum]|nr:bifunctional nuclease family protein [Geitlerinema splendidum]MDK3158632.1 bifunctional nuclease family protein [Kamptonema cortianum]
MPDERQDEPEDLDHPPAFFPYDEENGEVVEVSPGEPVECQVEAVFAAQSGDTVQKFVLLTDGQRKLPIVIGGYEATAITFALENQQPDRPMTHDLFAKVLERLNVDVEKVLIDDLMGATYYAKIFMTSDGEELIVDSRPSDALALAVRVGCPIYVAEGILEAHDQ